MLKNHLVVALRTIRRRPGYAAINVTGLAVGLACCLLIGLWVRDEMSYDRHLADGERIVRLVADQQGSEGVRRVAVTPTAWGPALAQEHPAVEAVARFSVGRHRVSHGGGGVAKGEGPDLDDATHLSGTRLEATILHADPSFFEVFALPLLRGDPDTVLDDPYNLVISRRLAEQEFPGQDPVGKLFKIDDRIRGFEVVGVMEDVPEHTHFAADVVMPFAPYMEDALAEWEGLRRIYTYLKLAEPGAAPAVEAALSPLVARHLGADDAARYTPRLQPLHDLHLRSDREFEIQPGGDARTVWLFSVAALFVLLVACVNFTNLATARGADRAREVGVRKALGAGRGHVAGQALTEAFLLAVTAVALAVGVAGLALPSFNAVSGKSLALGDLHPGALLGLLALGALGVGGVAGAYPALVLSRFAPTRALGHGRVPTDGASVLRRGLVVFQFATAIGLVACTAVVWQQWDHLQSKRLGFDREHVVVLPRGSHGLLQRREAVKAAMREHPGVRNVALVSRLLGQDDAATRPFRRPPQALPVDAATLHADADAADVLDLEMAAGRWFAPGHASDSTAFVVNETAARMLGFASARAAVGHRIEGLHRTEADSVTRAGPVLGVVRDFNFRSLRHEIDPLVVQLPPMVWDVDHFIARVDGGDVSGALAGLEATWKAFAFYPEYFSFSFLDAEWAALYRSEQQLRAVVTAFAALALCIAALGLVGLAALAAQRRRREVGVRKVLGATVLGLVGLLTRDFVVLVLAAFAVAAPVAWLAMSRWLDGFAYRVDLGVGVFALAGALVLVVALATIGYHALRAATSDPVEALRYE
jgi:putative ABC transport system permease protein